MLNRFARLAPLLALAVTGACTNPFESRMCTASVEPAIVVEIRDARTGAAVAANARGAIRDGAYVDSLRPAAFTGVDTTSMFSRAAGLERAGTYDVEVVRAGYQPWRMDDVRVRRDECHVVTRHLDARLEPIG